MKIRNVMQGMHGPDVKAVQQGLNKVYPKQPIKDDGAFGTNTDKAVRRFQEARGLNPDGIVGPITRSALFPLVAVTINIYGTRIQGDTPVRSPIMRQPATLTGGAAPARLNIGFGIPLPVPIPLPFPLTFFQNEFLKLPNLAEPVLAPKPATPPGTRIVVDWQQFAQTQRQFDGLFTNPQDTFAVGWQSVFKRRLLNPDERHLEIATGCLLQSPIGIQDQHGNDFTIGCFAQATWVESLGRAGIFQWAPYAQLQGQANPTGPANPTGSLALFPIALNVNLSKLGLDFDDLTFQAGIGPIGSVKWTPRGLESKWGSQAGVGLVGKVWFFGN